MGVYYKFAEAFGFTPDQVDQLDNYTIEAFAIMGKTEAEEQERAMKGGRR